MAFHGYSACGARNSVSLAEGRRCESISVIKKD